MKARKHLIPDVVSDQTLITVKPEDSARHAAVLMDKHAVSSVLVLGEGGKLAGIFTVRDVARRIVGGLRDPDTTPVAEVMTKELKCVAANEHPHRALRLMQDSRFRHLPVTEDGKPDSPVLAIVSRRNFFPDEEALLQFEDDLWEHMR